MIKYFRYKIFIGQTVLHITIKYKDCELFPEGIKKAQTKNTGRSHRVSHAPVRLCMPIV